MQMSEEESNIGNKSWMLSVSWFLEKPLYCPYVLYLDPSGRKAPLRGSADDPVLAIAAQVVVHVQK